MFRREWRQQLLVVTLLTVAVAAAIGSVTIAYNSRGATADNAAEFGSAKPKARVRRLRPARSSRRGSTSPGSRSGRSTSSVTARPRSQAASRRWTIRTQDPGGPYGGELLALRRGSYPTGPTRSRSPMGSLSSLRLELGSTLALDGVRRAVVGIVENPRKLSDEFALVSPSSAHSSDTCQRPRGRR